MIKIPDKHILVDLRKIKEIKRRTPDGNLLRYPIENLFDQNLPKGMQPVDEANALYELDEWGVIKIDRDEPSGNGLMYYLKVLPKFEKETYPYYEKKFTQNKQITPQSGLGIKEEDEQQLNVQYNGRTAKNPLRKNEQYTHILYYIINNNAVDKSSFTDLELLEYLVEVDSEHHFSPPLKASKSTDNLRKSRDRHLDRIANYLRDEFPVLRRREIWRPISGAGAFNWLLK